MPKKETLTQPEAKQPELMEPDAAVVISEPDESDAAKQMRLFRERIMAERNKPVPVYVPPPMNSRQQAQREAEMAAGRARVAKAKEQEAVRSKPVKTPADATMTPVYRPGGFTAEAGNASKELRTVRG